MDIVISTTSKFKKFLLQIILFRTRRVDVTPSCPGVQVREGAEVSSTNSSFPVISSSHTS